MYMVFSYPALITVGRYRIGRSDMRNGLGHAVGKDCHLTNRQALSDLQQAGIRNQVGLPRLAEEIDAEICRDSERLRANGRKNRDVHRENNKLHQGPPRNVPNETEITLLQKPPSARAPV